MCGCSTSCANRCSSRRRPRTCSRSSAARHSTCSRYSRPSPSARSGYAEPTRRSSSASTASSCARWWRSTPLRSSRSSWRKIRSGRDGAAGRAALERRTIHIHDVMIDPEYTYGSKSVDPIRTVLTVPMLKGEDLLGVILTYRLEVKPFTDKQVALIETFADQAVIAIENVRLFEAEQARTRELSEALE